MFGFSLFLWIFEKIIDWKIKSVNETLDKIQKPLERKILVIDDDRGMKSYIEKFMTGSFKVDQLYSIPDDLSVLRGYDAVVVDGMGIGNSRFKEGLDLLMAYDKPEGQSVVYHSGLGAYGRERDALSERGVAVVTKGSNPEKLTLAIRFAMMKGEKSC
jgi:DNA-binding response OmpR family regulator